MSSQAHHSLLMFDYPREDGGEEQDLDADKELMKKMFATNISHHQNKGEKEEDKEEETKGNEWRRKSLPGRWKRRKA